MEVVLAEHSGFCFGVKRAVDYVYELIGSDDKIYTYGPIIHNDEVVSDLKNKGVEVINTPDEIRQIKEGTVVIRAHGVPKDICEIFEKNGINYVDGTCPFVKRIHNTVSEMSAKGYRIVIIGSAGHPEVLGIMGWAGGTPIVIENHDEAMNFNEDIKVPLCIVAQTTFNQKKFKELVEIISNKGYNVNVVNTICNATRERQESADKIASIVDAMIVIGGKNSSNTQKLFDICREKCPNTFFVQTVEDIDFDLPKAASLVGITAGASTPNNIIEEVQNYVRINF